MKSIDSPRSVVQWRGATVYEDEVAALERDATLYEIVMLKQNAAGVSVRVDPETLEAPESLSTRKAAAALAEAVRSYVTRDLEHQRRIDTTEMNERLSDYDDAVADDAEDQAGFGPTEVADV